MTWWLNLVIVSVFLNGVFCQDNPYEDPNICGLPSCKGKGKFNYGPDLRQAYKYSVKVRNLFNGTSPTESTLFLEGNVELAFLSHCDGLLTLSDFELSEVIPRESRDGDNTKILHKNSELFNEKLTEFTVRFNFEDGKITEVCPTEEEPNWILNFKRGLLSMLHNTMKRFDIDHTTLEEDIRGLCPTTYTVNGARETSLIVDKVKDLNACQRNAKLHSIIQSTPYGFSQQHENILSSTSHCQISIDHNIYNQVLCTEKHVFQPFSNQNSGATTIVQQKLVLESETASDPIVEQPEITRRTTLAYDHLQSSRPEFGDLKDARDLIKKLCKMDREKYATEFSDVFIRLVHSMRLLSYSALSALLSHTRSICHTGKKHLLDALPYVNTGVSVTVMKDIILRKSIPDSLIDDWLSLMGFIATPNKDIMSASQLILENRPFSPNLVLSLSALTHTYCLLHTNCHEEESVQAIIQKFQDNVREYYDHKDQMDSQAKYNFTVSLKALANTGRLTNNFEETLFDIIEDLGLPIEIRLAAVESFRRQPCLEHRTYFLELFKNNNENVEIRIAAYLLLIRCPDYKTIQTLKQCLDYEEVNQVGSFVWTHLNNLLTTACPYKVEIQSLLSEEDLSSKFVEDKRKFSYNREGSLHFEKYNLGANYESNVIFTPDSFVPKSAMLNLTVDIFGNSINFLELTGRAEGFEHYLENLFGPKRTNPVKEKVDQMRIKRSIGNNDIIKAGVDKLANPFDSVSKDPRVMMGVKVFGNELKYTSLDGEQQIRSSMKNFSPMKYLQEFFSGKEVNYNKAAIFLDSTYIIPSGAGLPISLNVFGTASVNLKLNGSLHSTKDNKRTFDLLADLQPTVAVGIVGEMSVDAFYTNSGIKLKTNTYTSTAVTAQIKIEGTKLISIKFSLPWQNTEIFGASSELLVKKQDTDVTLNGFMRNVVSDTVCSWPAAEKTIGLKFCIDYSFVNVSKVHNVPYFLLAGPCRLRWYLNKLDPAAKSYVLEYRLTEHQDIKSIAITFDTPESTVKRLISFNLTMGKENQNLTMELQSTVGLIQVQGKIKNTELEKSFEADFNINDKKHFDLALALLIEPIRNGVNYLPKAYLGVNGATIMELKGSVETLSKKDITQHGLNLKFQTKRLRSKLFGYILRTDASLSTNLDLDYKFVNTREERINLNFSVADRSRRNLALFLGFCRLNTTAYSNSNFNTEFNFTKSNSHTNVNFKLIQHPLLVQAEDDPLMLLFQWNFDHKTYTDSSVEMKTGVIIRRKSTNLDINAKAYYESNNPNINSGLSITYGPQKEVAVKLFWSHPRTAFEQITAHLNVSVPTFTPLILKLELQESINSTWQVDFGGVWFSGHNISAVGIYQDRSTAVSLSHNVKLYLKSNSFKDIDVYFQVVRDNSVLKFEIKGVQDSNQYHVMFDHEKISLQEMKTLIQLQYKLKQYSMKCLLFNGSHKKLTMEVRIDQIRDIHFSAWGYNQPSYKAAGLELKWDANRDPNQKLMITGNFTKIKPLHYNADLLIGYPSRTIIAQYKFLIEKGLIDTLGSVSWGDDKSLALIINVQHDFSEQISAKLVAKIITPFAEMKSTDVDVQVFHALNKYSAVCSVKWSNTQNVLIDIFGDYSSDEEEFWCQYHGTVGSSLSYIPNWILKVEHLKNSSTFNSDLHVELNPEFKIKVDSKWNIHRDKIFTNLSGTVKTVTPFKNLTECVVASELYITNDKYMRGVADIDLNHIKISVNLEGRYRKLMNSMLTVNISTEEDDYQLRYLLSKEQRHVIAFLTYPNGSLGAEALVSVKNLSNFDVKLALATPLYFFEDILILAKLQNREADFRLKWNQLQVGFAGIWRYNKITDFEYSYQLYTPIERFESNGVVAKLKLIDGVDFEASAKVSTYKLGAKLMGKTLPKRFEEIFKRIQNEQLSNENLLNWKGLIELDTIFYPTIKGHVEVEQKGRIYFVKGRVILLGGYAVFNDEFGFNHMFSFHNKLVVTTPYKNCKTILSSINVNLSPGVNYLVLANVEYENNTVFKKMGAYGNFSLMETNFNGHAYNLTVSVDTPLDGLNKNYFSGLVTFSPQFYSTYLLVYTDTSNIFLDGKAIIMGQTMESNVKLFVKTPSVELPMSHVNFKRFKSPTETIIDATVSSPEKLQTDIILHAYWLILSRQNFDTKLTLTSPFKGMNNVTLALAVDLSPIKSTIKTQVHLTPIIMNLQSNYSNSKLQVDSLFILKGQSFPLNINCSITPTSVEHREFSGDVMFKEKLFKISGYTNLGSNAFPKDLLLVLTPEKENNPIKLAFELQPITNGLELQGSLKYFDKITKFNAQATTESNFDWVVHGKLIPPDGKTFLINVEMINGKSRSLLISGETPIKLLEKPKAGVIVTREGLNTNVNTYFETTTSKGNISVDYIWKFLDNMYVSYLGKYQNQEYSSKTTAEFFYKNPEKLFKYIQVGGDVKVDSIWETASNVTLDLSIMNAIGIEAHVKLPKIPLRTHSVFGKYSSGPDTINYLARYLLNLEEKKYGSWGQISYENRKNLSANIDLEINQFHVTNQGNFLNKDGDFDVIYRLKTPQYKDQDFLVAKMYYNAIPTSIHNVTFKVFQPSNNSVAFTTVKYQSFSNMDGRVNFTIPYKNLKYIGGKFLTKTDPTVYIRNVDIFWNNKTVKLNGICKSSYSGKRTDQVANVYLELPLTTNHYAHLQYNYSAEPELKVGKAIVLYNNQTAVTANYKCLSEISDHHTKDNIHVDIINQLFPVATDYIHLNEISNGLNNKFLHLYNPMNRSTLNITGEVTVRQTKTGPDYKLTATHLNRTMKIYAKYNSVLNEYRQFSRVELRPDKWLDVHFNLFNRTIDETFDHQAAELILAYPNRNITFDTSYNISDTAITTDFGIKWDMNKTVEGQFDWKRKPINRDEVEVRLKHPSFEKDITFYTDYGYNKTSMDANFVVSYSLDDEQTIRFSGVLSDKSNLTTYNYTYLIQGEHRATNLLLDSRGNLFWENNGYGTEHYTSYQRSYLPFKLDETIARVNLRDNLLELKRQRVDGVSTLVLGYTADFPIYTMDITAINENNDTHGDFFINIDDKFVKADFNLTKDGSQSFHIYGLTPDARSARLNIWRDYQDRRLDDVSYFLNLNHSRLIISKLKWRPELISDVQKTVHGFLEQIYYNCLENINDTKQYIQSESMEALDGFLKDSRQYTQEFTNDLRNLTIIENDITYLKQFLNESYNVNFFYMQDISGLFSELSLKSHFQALPKIIQEIVEVMGESRQKIEQSVIWMIEKVKVYYTNAVKFIYGLINGDPIEHVSELFKQLIEKYDDFIKNMHVQFLRYMENLYEMTYKLIMDHWHKTLAALEPTFIKFLHYLEVIVWNTSKDFLDFLYLKKTELIVSPYFAKFTSFSHDADKFYRDITGNNTIASVYKYSKVTWNFLRDKYLNVVPFGRELQAIVYEIISELKQLLEIPTIKYALDKVNKTYNFFKYYYDYFNVESRLHRFVSAIYTKMGEMSLTALEVENKQREAKTNFYFETSEGVMLLEQKLPMAWHAFNETPQFQDLPELKTLYTIQSYFSQSESTFWDWYYEYFPFTNPFDLIPPFKEHAMLIGSKFFVTFDQQYYNFSGGCTYVLARDFVDHNFTILLSSDDKNLSNNELILLVNQTIVRINVFTDNVVIEKSKNNRLPCQIDEVFIYRHQDIVTATNGPGFTLQCNMKFHICSFELSGWYFGKTAGLWGTLNNENFDDFLMPNKVKANSSNLEEFAQSWAVDSCSKPKEKTKTRKASDEIQQICEDFYESRVSELTSCFNRVPKDSFMEMCLQSRSEDEACSSALAYINLCSYQNIFIRIPDNCVKCHLPNGTILQEGEPIQLRNRDLNSADVVFIVEAKSCNEDILERRSLDSVIDSISKELGRNNITNQRFGLVTFGGDGVNEEPRNVILDGNTFTDSKNFANFFRDLPAGNGSNDIFNSIVFAKHLPFRLDAQKIFVLIPCSECFEENMEQDYPTIHQLLFDNAISLHILLNEYFTSSREFGNKYIYGIDSMSAFSRKDVRGNTSLRKSVNFNKSNVNSCVSLALESNGSIFSARFLEEDKKNVRKFASIFGKRISRSVVSNKCLDCECTAPNTGIAYIECYPCIFPTRTNEKRFHDDALFREIGY